MCEASFSVEAVVGDTINVRIFGWLWLVRSCHAGENLPMGRSFCCSSTERF